MAQKFRIIAVCTGNICRSPMVEYMISAALERVGLDDGVVVDSAGIERWEVGNPIDRRAAQVLSAHGIDSGLHRARQFRPEWLAEANLVLALDNGHLDALRSMAGAPEPAKIQLLRSFDPAADGADLSVADPWGGDLDDFTATWDQIDAALPGIVNFLRLQVATRNEDRR